MIARALSESTSRSLRFVMLCGSALLASSVGLAAPTDQMNGVGTLVVSRILYVAPTPAPEPFPQIFNHPNVSGIQGNVFLDYYKPSPGAPLLSTLPLTASAVKQGQPIITTSFSSKSEGSLHLSLDGHYVTYMGYNGAAGLEGVSNSETTNPNAQITGATGPFYDRAAALVKYDLTVTVTIEDFAYSGDNPRGAITLDGKEFYMAGNADSTTNAGGTTGPGRTIGARLGLPGSKDSIQLGTYLASDRPDESAKNHVKDNNWRGIGIFADASGVQNLYVSKGSGGNGDDGVFQVLNGNFPNATLAQVVNGTGAGVPTGGTNNTIVQLLGNQATNPNTNGPSPLTPFGFFFANPTTLYVADEGNSTITLTTANGQSEPISSPIRWPGCRNGCWFQEIRHSGSSSTSFRTGSRSTSRRIYRAIRCRPLRPG